jgi:ubiquinone/menaquinone biosynthesis C-methylase UbiE
MGRALATPMSYRGADWLERADRESTERPEHVLDVIALKPGDVVADVGAGSGYFSVRIARRVGAEGHVIATDLQPEMLAMIEKKVAAGGLGNLETRRATVSDAGLPRAAVDVVLMVDVYHELQRPDLTLAQVRDALRPKGRLVLVEYRAEDPSVPIKPEHKMTLAQIARELAASSFSIASVDESLPRQRIVTAVAADAGDTPHQPR